MASTTVRVLAKFARLNPRYEDFTSLSEAAAVAFGGQTSGGELGFEAFKIWFESCEFAQDLQRFVDENSSSHLPEAIENPMRRTVRMLEYKARELRQQLDQLQVKIATIERESPVREPQQQRRYDTLRQNLE